MFIQTAELDFQIFERVAASEHAEFFHEDSKGLGAMPVNMGEHPVADLDTPLQTLNNNYQKPGGGTNQRQFKKQYYGG